MKITDDLVDHISHLARLKFEGDNKEAIKKDMENIISFMDKLSELPTGNVEPLIFMNDEVNVLREDNPNISVTQDEALKNAPKKDSDYFRIPKVLSNTIATGAKQLVVQDPFEIILCSFFRSLLLTP